MKEKHHSQKVQQTGERMTMTTTSPKVHWDQLTMKSYSPNAFKVTLGHDEISLLFGMQQIADNRYTGEPIRLSNRIILNPFTAKRLAKALKNAMHEYETRYGSQAIKSSPSIQKKQFIIWGHFWNKSNIVSPIAAPIST